MRCAGEKHHLHLPHLIMSFHGPKKDPSAAATPKGFMVVRVGQQGEEQLQRFMVPVMYLNHPLFVRLLKEAEEEYGFQQEGAITIPCRVDYFRQVQGLIEQESSIGDGGHFHLHLIHLSGWCFRPS